MNRAIGDDDRDDDHQDDGPDDAQDSGQDGGQDERFGGIEPLKAADPRRIGAYQLLGRLGAGGMGRVYLARSEGGRTVAVKVVHEEHTSDTQFRARFRREINAARRVGERFTAPVLDADADADRPWVATGYVPGPSLDQVVRQYGPLPADSVHTLALGLLRALADIHAAGIVHRDLKPSNVMLTVEGPRVIDFGVARALDSMESLLTSTGMVIGSPGFMSPEQVRGQSAGPKSDVFTLGCVLMFAATGLLPFGQGAKNRHAVMYQIAEDAPDLEAVRNDGLQELIGRCLTKRVSERPDVAALLAELEGSDTQRRLTAKKRGASWLPPELVADLAQQAARLLDVDVPLVREPAEDASAAGNPQTPPVPPTPQAPPSSQSSQPSQQSQAPDRATAALRQPKPAAGAGPGAGGTEAGDADAGTPVPAVDRTGAPEPRARRRKMWALVIPVLAALAVGGGTVLLLQPFDGHKGAAPSDRGTVTARPEESGGTSAPAPSGKKKPSPSPKGKDGKKGEDGKNGDDAKGAGGAGSSGGDAGDGGGQGSSGGAPAGSDSSGGSTGGSSSGGGDGGSSGGTSGGSGGSSGDGNKVPSYFLGTWTLADPYVVQQPTRISISRGATGGQVARLVTDEAPGVSHCEHVAKLVSVTNGGSQLNLGTATVVPSHSASQCAKADPSSLVIASSGGTQHRVGPAHGDGYRYERAG